MGFTGLPRSSENRYCVCIIELGNNASARKTFSSREFLGKKILQGSVNTWT
jgi:hypothetical protein